MAFDGHVQAPRSSARQTGNVTFGTPQLREDRIRQLQQTQPGTGETHGFGLACEQRHAHPLFQLLELMGQGRLRQVQALGCFHKAVGLAQGVEGFQVADFQHRELHE